MSNEVVLARQSFAGRVWAWLNPETTVQAQARADKTRKDVLLALVLDDIRESPSEWKTIKMSHWVDGIENKTNNFKITFDDDHWRSPKVYPNANAKLNGISISNEDLACIKHVFEHRFIDGWIEKFVEKRLKRLGDVQQGATIMKTLEAKSNAIQLPHYR